MAGRVSGVVFCTYPHLVPIGKLQIPSICDPDMNYVGDNVGTAFALFIGESLSDAISHAFY